MLRGCFTGVGERQMAGDGAAAGFPGGGACGDEGKVQGAKVRERGAQGLMLVLYRPREGEGAATGPIGHQWPWRLARP
jgi:hypothetical protein